MKNKSNRRAKKAQRSRKLNHYSKTLTSTIDLSGEPTGILAPTTRLKEDIQSQLNSLRSYSDIHGKQISELKTELRVTEDVVQQLRDEQLRRRNKVKRRR